MLLLSALRQADEAEGVLLVVVATAAATVVAAVTIGIQSVVYWS